MPGIAGQAEEVGREAPARSRADLHPVRPDLGPERREERRGGVGRPVVARDQPPVAMPLSRDRRKLLAQEGRPVIGAHQDGDLRAGGLAGHVRRSLHPGTGHPTFRELRFPAKRLKH